MASNDRSSYINLYSFEDKSDDNFKFSIENKQAKLAVSSASPMEFDAFCAEAEKHTSLHAPFQGLPFKAQNIGQ